nr:glycosyltransferase [Leifsonia sp. Leaf325]
MVDAGYKVTLIAVESAIDGPVTGVEVIALPRTRRLKRMSVGAARAVYRALRSGARIVHCHDPELAVWIPLLRIAGRKVIYDAHEDLPEQVSNKPYARGLGTVMLRSLAGGIIRLARSANHIIAATETIADRFPAGKVSVVHNYPPLRSEELHAVPLVERPEGVVYVGGIGPLRGSAQMIAATENEAFPAGWTLELAGPLDESMRDSNDLTAYQRVNYHGQVGPVEARDLLLESRVGLSVLQDSPAYRESLPTKMFEYFAAGMPVIASDFPLWRSIVEGSECGMLVDETSPASIAQALERYAHDPELLTSHGRNARHLAETRLNWGHEVPVLLSAYDTTRGVRSS